MKKAPMAVNVLCGLLLFACFVYAPWSLEKKDSKGHVEMARFKSAPIWSVPELESRETAQMAFGLLTVRLVVIAGLWMLMQKAVSAYSFKAPKLNSPTVSQKTLNTVLVILLLPCGALWGKILLDYQIQKSKSVKSDALDLRPLFNPAKPYEVEELRQTGEKQWIMQGTNK